MGLLNKLLCDTVQKCKDGKIPAMNLDELEKEIGRFASLILNTSWKLEWQERGMGHGDYGILVDIEGVDYALFENVDREIAESIIL